MQIVIKGCKINSSNLARKIGYRVNRYSRETSLNFIKRIGIDPYPRFHIYIKEEGEDYIINLHLDQKKASYKGNPAHSAEYDGEVVKREGERIKSIIF